MKKSQTKKSKSQPSAKIYYVIAVIFLVFGIVGWQAYSFTSTNVREQLSEQKIFFPEKGSKALDPATYPDLQKYGGQQVDNGEKAKAYADGYIKKHLAKIADGKTYSEVSSEFLKNPKDAKLAEQRQSLFMGTTLRGLLLNAYAFGVMATILKVISIISFAVAGLSLVLAVIKKKLA